MSQKACRVVLTIKVDDKSENFPLDDLPTALEEWFCEYLYPLLVNGQPAAQNLSFEVKCHTHGNVISAGTLPIPDLKGQLLQAAEQNVTSKVYIASVLAATITRGIMTEMVPPEQRGIGIAINLGGLMGLMGAMPDFDEPDTNDDDDIDNGLPPFMKPPIDPRWN